MNRFKQMVAGGVLSLALCASGFGFVFEFRDWESLSVRPESELTAAVFGPKPQRWAHGESDHFIVHGMVSNSVIQAAREAEFVLARTTDYFDQIPEGAKGHLVLVPDEGGWTRLLEAGGFRPDSLAMYIDNQIFVLRNEEERLGPLKIPAEVIHFQFQRTFGSGCPLWLEEGLTDYAGWDIAKTYFRQRYRRVLTRARPALLPDQVLSWDALSARTDYPADFEAARAYTRQINEMFRSIADRIGRDKVGRFMREICAGGKAWRRVLAESFGVNEADIRELEEQAAGRVQQEGTE